MKTKSVLGGTIILVIANFISKILGAILKIPLTYILGEEGMAIYHTTFNVYITVLLFVSSGIPFALSKYASSQLALGNRSNVLRAARISLTYMTILGLVGFGVLFFGAEFFALAMKDINAVISICAISPAVLFVAVGCVYKSMFEAYSNTIPTAISQVSEAVVKLVLGYLFAMFLSAFSVTYATSGAILAITIGELIATIILGALFIPYSKKLGICTGGDTFKTISKDILSVALPMTLTSVATGCFSLLETSIVRNKLVNIVFTPHSALSFATHYGQFTDLFANLDETLKLSTEGARWLYGAFSGYASTVFNLPIGVLASFGVTILPVVTRCITLKNYGRLSQVISSVMKLMMIVALPCSVIFYQFSDEILYILFKNTASSVMLKSMAPLLPIIVISNLLSAVLYASGDISRAFFNDIISSCIKMAFSFFLIGIPEINILGVVISSFFANTTLLILNIHAVRKSLKIKLPKASFIIKIFLALFSMASVCRILQDMIQLQNPFAGLLFPASVSMAVYLLISCLLGIVSKKELRMLQS